ncbi:hypothetical protein SBBP1_1330013 [Burkholderiales bacterium]|nr:hypothetical protein SBBP1_1330013 [Burkholderiales bacterium]
MTGALESTVAPSAGEEIVTFPPAANTKLDPPSNAVRTTVLMILLFMFLLPVVRSLASGSY